jgi:hypothetical protein
MIKMYKIISFLVGLFLLLAMNMAYSQAFMITPPSAGLPHSMTSGDNKSIDFTLVNNTPANLSQIVISGFPLDTPDAIFTGNCVDNGLSIGGSCTLSLKLKAPARTGTWFTATTFKVCYRNMGQICATYNFSPPWTIEIVAPQPTAPSPPTIGAATAGDASATVNWSPPSSDGGSPITNYTATSVEDNTKFCSVSSPALTCNVTGLTNGTPYTFTVTATNQAGLTSPPSASSNSVTPNPVPTAPGSPTQIIATAGDSSATINWIAPLNNGGSPITGYTAISSPQGLTCTTTGAITCNITGLTNGTSYTFSVTATNQAGFTSPASSPSNEVTPNPILTVPSAPFIGIATAGYKTATVNWSAPSSDGGSRILGYTATSNPGGATCAALGANATSCNIAGLTNGTAYTFTVTATNNLGIGPTSAPSNSVTPNPIPTIPGPPTQIIATAGNASAVINWVTPLNNGGSPIINYTATSVEDNTKSCSAIAPSLTCNIAGLTNGTAYTFTVTATNQAGFTSIPSNHSNQITPISPISAPSAPIIGTATAADASATINWSAPLNNGGTPIAGYTATSVEDNTKSCSAIAPSLTCNIANLSNGTPYTFTVTATNQAELTSPPSAPSNSVTPSPAPTRPDSPTAVTAAASDASATIHWTAPANNGGTPITNYTATSVEDNTKFCSVSSPALTCNVTGLTNSRPYTFTVTATNRIGTSDPSNHSNQVTPHPPLPNDPTITSISPIAGPINAGTPDLPSPVVTLEGTNFAPDITVQFGSNAPITCQASGLSGLSESNCIYQSPTQLTVSVPVQANAGAVDIIVQNPTGDPAISSHAYTYVSLQGIVSFRDQQAASAPIVPSPTTGNGPTLGGTGITLTGVFPPQNTPIELEFGTGNPATLISIDSTTQITANTPAVTGTGTVDVSLYLPGAPRILLGVLKQGYTYHLPKCIPGVDGVTECSSNLKACVYIPPNTTPGTSTLNVMGQLVTNNQAIIPQCVDAIPKFSPLMLPVDSSPLPRIVCTTGDAYLRADRETGACAVPPSNTGVPNLTLLSLVYSNPNKLKASPEKALVLPLTRHRNFTLIADPSETYNGPGWDTPPYTPSMQLAILGYSPQTSKEGFCIIGANENGSPFTHLPDPIAGQNYCVNPELYNPPTSPQFSFPWQLATLDMGEIYVINAKSNLIT